MSPADLQRIHASSGWRTHRVEVFDDTAAGKVLVKGQRSAAGAWRAGLLDRVARLIRVPMLAGDPHAHGAHAQATELRRLHELAAAGVPVPGVLHVADEFFVMQFVAGQPLDQLLRAGPAVLWWRRGLEFLAEVHLQGQYLSQAYTRNFIARGDQLVAIDFETDPLRAMPLDAAMARDWLAYLYTSPLERPLPHEWSRSLRHALAAEPAAVRDRLEQTAQSLAWVLRLRGESAKKSWRRYVGHAQAVIDAILGARELRMPGLPSH